MPAAQPDPAALLSGAGTIDLVDGGSAQPYLPAGTAGTASEDAARNQDERIALLLPLSGNLAHLGRSMLNAAQLALFDSADDTFELMILDTEGEPHRASEAARVAIEQGAKLIIGPLLAESTRAAAPWAQAAGVPILSFSSDRTVAGNGVFVLGFTPSEQVDRVIQYASGRGFAEFAVIAPQNAYGDLVVQAVQEAVRRGGGRLTDIQFAGTDPSGVTSAVQALTTHPSWASASPGDSGRALLIAEGGDRLRSIASQLEASGVAPGGAQLLGTGTWDEPWISGESALIGGWFAAPSPWSRSRFVQNYTQTYGETPPRLAGLAYDATALAAIVGRIVGPENLNADVLATPAGFIGSEGIFRFASSGVAERGLAVLEVAPQGVNVISDAPQSFVGI